MTDIMSVAALERTKSAPAAVPLKTPPRTAFVTNAGSIALELGHDVENYRDLWLALQAVSPCSPPQTFSFARAWQRHVLAPEGRVPVIVTGYGTDGAPVLLWAFEIIHKFGQPVLIWLGQEQANYNMGLYRPDIAAGLQASDVLQMLNWIAAQVGASAAVLKAQPYDWDGQRNPFADLPHQPHPSCGYAVTLGDFDTLYRSRFQKESRRKFTRRERKLAEYGEVVFKWADSRAEKEELIDTFFAQKEKQFVKMGVADPFTPPVRAFYRELALLEDDDPARLRLGFVRVGDVVAATFSGAISHDRLAVVMSSLADSELQRYSPGIVLLRRQIEQACEMGLKYYDIGVGAARHKERWCDVVRPLCDTFIPFTVQGRLVTMPLSGISSLKRRIKSNRVLWPLAQKVRKVVFGHSPEHDD